LKATAVLPVKRFDAAKQRLAAGIDEERRRELAAAMVADVLDAIGEARSIERLIVVTGDPIAQELAAKAGAEVIPDPEDAGHIEAAQAGIARAEAEGAERVALLAGDCPLLDPRELDRLLIGVPGSYVGIVPDRHGTGTNALLLAPPDAIAPSFGPGSRERHEQSAAASGARWRVAEPRSLVLDVDTAEDLAALRVALDARTGGAAHTRGLLARLDRHPPRQR
jgi:2-phospho-L-lactate guanylyltransferase